MAVWTEDQEAAIKARGSNLLVSAAAGSGKTAVLVERIIELLVDDGIDLDRLLIVTFTHAAAVEMRERIGRALIAGLEKKDANEAYLRRQINLLGHASISTIHAFCTQVVRSNFHYLGIDPNFRICSQAESELLQAEVLDDLFESEYEKGEDSFLTLIEMFGSTRDDTPFKNLVLKTFAFMQSQPDPLGWLRVRVNDFNLEAEDFDSSAWCIKLVEELRLELAGARSLLEEAMRWANLPAGPVMYCPALTRDIALIDNLSLVLGEQGIKNFLSQLPTVEFAKLERATSEVDPVLKDRVQSLRQAGKKIIQEMKQRMTHGLEEYINDLHTLYPYLDYLYCLEDAFTACYQARKVEKGLVDFNDLEHYTLRVLADDDIAEQYRQQFAYIFVDEYQDSNLVQETILNYIRRTDNLFLVGDVKQSIYRFRLADPSLFMQKYNSFADSPGALNRRINLNRNFRSRREIIDAINFIFSNIMSEKLGEINYDAEARLYPGTTLPPASSDAAVEVYMINMDASGTAASSEGETNTGIDEELEDMSRVELEARAAVTRIKALTSESFYDRNKRIWRNIDYGDIVVLLRTTRNWSNIFQEVFTSAGIPAYADVNGGYFEAREVDVILNLLNLIDNRRQDIPLLSIMRSPIGRFSLDDLIAVRTSAPALSYYEALEHYCEANDNPLSHKITDFMDQLLKWNQESRFMPLDEFIWKLLMDTGYYYYAGAMPGGSQRQANLRVLLDRARQFQATSMQGLFNFIKFIERLKAGTGDVGTASVLGENENVVRIMSIHKSKGLEFPAVILAGMGKRFNLADSSAPVLFHKDLGIGPRLVNPQLRTSTDTIARIAMKYAIKMENLAEEMRVLYVGLTRAQDKLIMLGTVPQIDRAAEKWAGSIEPLSLARGMNYFDWIGPVLVRHPDGSVLREAGRLNPAAGEMLQDDSKWEITIINRNDIFENMQSQENTARQIYQQLSDFNPGSYSSARNFVESRLNWGYGHPDAAKIPSKLSVTQIKKLKTRGIAGLPGETIHLVKSPGFCSDHPTISAREKGTIVHFVMQHLDFKRVGNTGQINLQLAEMVERELLLPEAAAAIDIKPIMAFFSSPLGKRVIASSRVKREVPFNLRFPANQIYTGLEQCNEELLIQGVIDLFFEEKDGLVLIDFKTDRVTGDDLKVLLEEYGVQVRLYRQALEQITRKKVKAAYLYFFTIGQCFPVS